MTNKWLTDLNSPLYHNLEIGMDYIEGELIITGRDKRKVEDLGNKEMEIGRYMAANRNYERDHNDERYRYNNLRTKLIDQRKRKEAREADKKF